MALEQKSLGAFYTDAQIADFLVWWGIQSGRETVLDPCFGGGVFLRSACKRIQMLRGEPRCQIFGVEIDPFVHHRISEKLRDEFSVPDENLILSDFFDITPDRMRSVDVVVGNPPFSGTTVFRAKSAPRRCNGRRNKGCCCQGSRVRGCRFWCIASPC